MKIDNKPIAVVSNEILKSSYNLSLNEHRILKSFLSSISYNEVISPEVPYRINVKEFSDFWNVPAIKVRQDILVDLKSMFDRFIYKKDSLGNILYSRWIQSIEYIKDEDCFEIFWTKKIIDHIAQLRERFCKLDLFEMKDFSSSYTFRLYEILTMIAGENSYRNPSFDVENLYFMMDVPESYLEYKFFKRRVLVPAITELQSKVKRFEKVKFDEIKIGKKVKEIKFFGIGVGNKYKSGK